MGSDKRYPAAFAYRFHRRFDLRDLVARLVVDVVRAKPFMKGPQGPRLRQLSNQDPFWMPTTWRTPSRRLAESMQLTVDAALAPAEMQCNQLT